MLIVNSIQTIIVMFLIIGIAIALCYFKIIVPEKHKDFVSNICLYVATPASMLQYLTSNFTSQLLWESLGIIVMSFAIHFIAMGMGRLLIKPAGVKNSDKGSFIANATMPNSLFLGIPICTGIFGVEAMHYILIFYIANVTCIWMFAYPMIAADGRGKRLGLGERLKKVFCSVAGVCLTIGILFVLLGWKLPDIALQVSDSFSKLTTALPLIFVGMLMYEKGLKGIKANKEYLAFTFLKFIFMPALTFMLCMLLKVDQFGTMVFTVISGLPAAAILPILAKAEGCDEYYATRLNVYSIVAGLLFTPVLVALMSLIMK